MENNQKANQLKLKFVQLDNDGDGFINKQQLQSFMKKQKITNVPMWKITQAMTLTNNKMSQENFIIWIMGCRIGLQDFAFMKFNFSQSIQKLQSAGPSPASPVVKKSSIDIQIGNENEQKASKEATSHFLEIQAGLNKQNYNKKINQLTQVLGHVPSQINLIFKFKAVDKGEQIAQKLQQILGFAIQLGSQLGPTAITIIECLTVTSKYVNGFIYVVLELNNTFFNSILNYLEEALNTLSPECKVLLKLKIASNFNNILKQNFQALNQALSLVGQFQIDGISLDKLKQQLVQNFQSQSDDKKVNMMLLFLLQSVNLTSSFSNLKQCFENFGINQHTLPQPALYAQQIKSMGIKDMVDQYILDGSQFLENLNKYCQPQGQVSFCAKSLEINLRFKLKVEGAFNFI